MYSPHYRIIYLAAFWLGKYPPQVVVVVIIIIIIITINLILSGHMVKLFMDSHFSSSIHKLNLKKCWH